MFLKLRWNPPPTLIGLTTPIIIKSFKTCIPGTPSSTSTLSTCSYLVLEMKEKGVLEVVLKVACEMVLELGNTFRALNLSQTSSQSAQIMFTALIEPIRVKIAR